MSGRRSDLRGIWDSLFLESGYSIYNEDDEIQGFFLLLEGILVKMKGFAVDWSSMKNHNQKLLVELKESKDECEKFKNKLEKHKGPCEECSKLAKELQETKKSAKDAQKRMDSIAKILKLGDSIDPSQNEKNSALNLVTQMLRGSPAKNKCQFVETEMPDSPKGNIIIPDSFANQIQLKSPSPKKKIVSPKKVTPQKRNFSTSFPMVNSPKKVAKKNLTTDFDDEIIDSSPQKPLSFSIAPLLNDSLLDYVKTNNSQLEKIWFNEEEEEEEEGEKSKPSPKKTEERTWSLKDRSGISKEKNQRGQRLKQLKLGIKHFKKETVDLSKFSQADDDCVIEQSPPEESRKKFKIKSTQSADTTLFKPLASSTQKPSTSRIFSDVDSSPDFIYKNDVVRKKAERKKLKGWDCEECEKYYTALGNQISPSKVQERMNACSRHRSKFKPTGGTPPEFWNPYFPDSQDCKNRGLYESVYAPK